MGSHEHIIDLFSSCFPLLAKPGKAYIPMFQDSFLMVESCFAGGLEGLAKGLCSNPSGGPGIYTVVATTCGTNMELWCTVLKENSGGQERKKGITI